MLSEFDLSLKSAVSGDCSQYAIGAVLERTDTSESLPVALASRTLKLSEQSYAAHERELLAIVEMIQV